MFSARLAIPLVAVIASLAVPGVASANTGSVTCDSTGVVFSYNANFGREKVSTETVNGVTQQFTVPKYTAVTHTWPGLSANAGRRGQVERRGDPDADAALPAPAAPAPAAPAPAAAAAACDASCAADAAAGPAGASGDASRAAGHTTRRAGDAREAADDLADEEGECDHGRRGLEGQVLAGRQGDRRHGPERRGLRQAAGEHDLRLARHATMNNGRACWRRRRSHRLPHPLADGEG